MDDPKLQIALVSGVAVLSGVVISQVISILLSFLDKRHQKQIMLREKYERMMFYLADSKNWLVRLNNCETLAEIYAQSQDMAAGKALALCLLYFPGLVDPCNSYIMAQVKYFEHVAKSFSKDIRVNAGGQAMYAEAGKPLVAELVKAKNLFENLIVSNKDVYIKA